MFDKNKKNIVFITLIGSPLRHYNVPVKVGDKVCLVKEPNNPADNEAIKVQDSKKEDIGYVSNSVQTVAQGTWSAGRLYDKIGNCHLAKIKFVHPDKCIIAEVDLDKEC